MRQLLTKAYRHTKNVISKMKNTVTEVATVVGNKVTAAALAVVGFVTSASAEVSIPDTGTDVSGYITAAITAMGAVIAVVVGGYFAFLIIRKALRWAGRALG